MDNNRCPLCGKDTINDERFCRNCQEIAENSDPSRLSNSSQSSESPSDIELPKEIIEEKIQEEIILNEKIQEKEVLDRKKENKKSWKIAVLITLILLITVATGGYIYFDQRKDHRVESDFWTSCVETNTPNSYADYLQKYPNGKYVRDAEQHIKSIRGAEQEEWLQVRKINNLDKYAAFLIDHPNSPYSSSIRQAMDSLSWVNASKENTADAYKVYLENIQIGTITGEYQSQAQERYNYLSQLKTLEGKELIAVENAISSFYKALSTLNSNEINKMLEPQLSTFYTMENIKSDTIVSVLKSQMKDSKIKKVSFIATTDSLTAIMDNKNIIFVTLPVVREVLYVNKKKETINQKIDIEMNDKLLISKIAIENTNTN